MGQANKTFQVTAEVEAEVKARKTVPHGTIAMAAITEEDLELDRELARMATQEPPVSDIDNMPVLKRETQRREMLSDYMDNYSPATTVNELLDQVHQAKEAGCDSIEATPAMVKHYCRKDFKYIQEHTGYFIFDSIKVYIAGEWEKVKDKQNETIQQRLFGPKGQ